MKQLTDLTLRLNRLARLLVDLKVRIRDAISGELSRIVALTVQEAVDNLLQPKPPAVERDLDSNEGLVPFNREDDPWLDDPDDQAVGTPPVTLPHDESNGRRQRSLVLAGAVLRGAITNRWSPWLGFGLAGLAGAAAWWGGPPFHTGLGLLLTVAELIAFGSSTSLR